MCCIKKIVKNKSKVPDWDLHLPSIYGCAIKSKMALVNNDNSNAFADFTGVLDIQFMTVPEVNTRTWHELYLRIPDKTA